MGKRVLMQGNEAVVEGALAAGMRVFAGYPITPSTEIAELSALRLPMVGGTFIQMEDEISSMAVVAGASVAGVKAMTATSGPGFSLKQENIGYACLAEIPCVVVDVQRAGPSTGLPTAPAQGDYMQARWGTHGDHPVIALSPSSVAEAYELTIRAFNLSEKYRTPVILLMDEMVGHLREDVELPDQEELAIFDRTVSGKVTAADAYAVEEGKFVPEMPPFGQGTYYNITGLMHDGAGFPAGTSEDYARFMRRLLDKIDHNLDDIVSCEEYRLDDAETAVICFGGTCGSARAAVDDAREKGMRVGMLRPITVWPFPEAAVHSLAERVERIVMVEHNDGQMLREVQRAAAGACRIEFIGRLNGTVIEPDEILAKLEEG